MSLLSLSGKHLLLIKLENERLVHHCSRMACAVPDFPAPPAASCWVMAAVDSVSTALAIATLPLGGDIPFHSTDQVLLCSNTNTNEGAPCKGGFPTDALDYAVEVPLIEDVFYRNSRTCTNEVPIPPSLEPLALTWSRIHSAASGTTRCHWLSPGTLASFDIIFSMHSSCRTHKCPRL